MYYVHFMRTTTSVERRKAPQKGARQAREDARKGRMRVLKKAEALKQLFLLFPGSFFLPCIDLCQMLV